MKDAKTLSAKQRSDDYTGTISGRFFKFVVFVPATHTDQILKALADAGAGKMGNYDRCSFVLRGTGRFRPLQGADPHIGTTGVVEEIEEDRIEVIVPEDIMRRVLEATRAVHPYEEMAFDVYPLLNHQFMKND